MSWVRRVLSPLFGPERRHAWQPPDWLMRAASANLAGIEVTEKSALGLTGAYACINVIATDVASLPLRCYRRQPNGGRVDAPELNVDALLRHSPDGETTSMRWRQAWLGHALGWGNGLAEIERDGAGRVVGLHLLDPGTAKADRHPQNKRLHYRLGNGKTLPARNVLHLAGLGFDGLCGYSPIRLFRQAIALGLAQEAFGTAFYGNAVTPRGALKTAQKLSKESIDRVREQVEALHRGADNAHRLLMLPEGLEFQPFSINPEDAQFLASRQFQVIEICRVYRVPPHKVGDYSQSHLANIEASNLDYLTTTLVPWLEAIEQEMGLKLLSVEERAAGYYVEHNSAAILRGDMRARAEFYTKLRDLGALNPNEVRAMENMNPLGPDGEKYLVPLNMITLDQAGLTQPTETMPDASRAAVRNGRSH